MSLTSLTAQDSVTHYSRAYTRGAAGGRVLTRTTVGTKTCRIQPMTAEQRAQLLQSGQEVDANLYFSTDPACDVNDEFEDDDGIVYQVVGVTNTDKLDRLWKVRCVVLEDET